ncbi:phospholipid-translocating P-type ATPase [Suhomyces tanzawaensis NRRL Y-17324]|uniref:Phospholipid-transporting ATPase n=1 Tax=Suhomyces tanzawaensis NRRL Y-17324 TaxID=984487 RepID=A0A1E4SNQ9_9ASCO|nr:phospholipid-translocating P-type ATPase [Suhomyces tanzawaensis NRRL Y-17324]ODV81057.1 phospholipid-translocating P-type ATPase [Suhomyces tanzawaensis NRRL Y-17324]
MSELPPSSLTSKDDGQLVKEQESASTNNHNHKVTSSGSSASDDTKACTVQDLVAAPPPTFKDKVKRFLFDKGLVDRPDYLQQIYVKVPRYIYVNQPLPPQMTVGGDGSNQHPVLTYPRNKIRTTKYTPLSFLPKNILFQFRNVANVYFLVLVILGAFQIFGVDSPGLAAVPLIVIVCITAIKDAFEDYRRAISDSQLNNSPIHLLQGLENPNVLVNEVSLWRRFKKRCSRITGKVTHGIAKGCVMVFARKEKRAEFIRQEHYDNENALRRVSTIVSDYSYNSANLPQGRPSVSSPKKSMQSRRSRLGPPPPPTKPIANTLLNPSLQKDNLAHENLRAAFKNRRWKDVAMGDIIRIRANEEVPADIIVLSSSDIEGNCYIETKNLDGETNLKTKNCLQAGGADHLKHSNDFLSTKFWVECDAPNPNLYSFRGTIHYENFDLNGQLVNPDEKEAVTNDNVLLRGCMLRNTKWVIGLVVYTGSETKIMLNSGITPTKSSLISRELNLSVIINFLLLFILCLISGVVNGTFYNKKDVSRLYFDFEPYSPTAAGNGVLAFFVALIIYQSLVPISLYISVEIIKTLQAFFIFSDMKMYYEKLDFPCIPKAWNISDDLGQIEYVFSDKTGTLTQNVMEFKKCTINGKSYGLAYTEAKQGLDKRDGLDTVVEAEKWKRLIQKDKEGMLEILFNRTSNDQLREDNVTFVSEAYVKDTILGENGSKQKEANITFMQALALCHTVVTEPNELDPELRDFKAESPDEAALVAVARDVGIVFKDRARKLIHIAQYGQDSEYELVDIIGFTSARKRMSCIIRTPENKYLLITKGADNVIFQRLDGSANSNEVVHKTALHLEDYAKEGLRTLCIAQRELDPKVYHDWSRRYKDAHASIDDSRDEIIERLAEEIETDLILLGGTAIEDRLQAGVPDSIAILGEAGIKLWVLTGDRIETAINIGFSCNLLENNMKLLVVRPEEGDQENIAYIDGLITKYLQENFGYLQNDSDEEVDRLIKEARKDHSAPSANHALVIDGAALSLVFRSLAVEEPNDPSIIKLQEKFLLLGKQCKSVICCRVSPAQKAQVVKMVKNNLGVMTLAIGDGANDVAMIQAANVGVGIAGEEGRQAVMSSDYAIGQFRFLTRLLLVHGRWSYKRLAEMVPCFFYKNVTFTLTCFWFGIYNNFDGSYLFEYTFLMFFNLAFTSLPVIVLAVLDQDVSDTVSLLVPQLYRSGILGAEWSQFKFSWYMFDGLYQSVIAFFFPYLLYYRAFQNPQGLSVDHRFWIGITVCMVTVTACDIYVLLRQYRWDWLTLLIDAISILLVFFWAGAWSARQQMAQEFYKAGAQTLGTLSVWCVFFISVILCLLPRFTYDFLKSNFKPRDIDIVREMVRKGQFDDYPAGYDPTDAEDIERHRILNQLIDTDPETLQKLEREQFPEFHEEDIGATSPIKKTFKSIKRKATITRSKLKSQSRSRRDTLNENFKHPIDITELRRRMIQEGEYNTGARNSLERINTTHELPGLTQAETLISYHTRTSINLR